MFSAMVPVLEAVPNFSEGRDPDWLRGLVDRIAATGADVLDWSSDPDHNRSVVTFVGDPATVEEAAIVAARHAVETLDLRTHRGVHPRVGAVDVLPFVPLNRLTMEDAVRSARRVGAVLAGGGLPVYFYGAASTSGRSLSEIRRGGFEAFQGGYPAGREPDLPPTGRSGPHPTAGVVCVGARPILLAWNVYVEGVAIDALRGLAAQMRERGGGFRGLRALAFELRTRRKHQISMNLEDLNATAPFEVYRQLEARIQALGGRVAGTEVVGMIPDGLVLPAAEDRLQLLDFNASRLLPKRLAEHISARFSRDVQTLLGAIAEAGDEAPAQVRAAAERLSGSVRATPTPDMTA
jgi:glutamate formiminotransferase